MIRRWIFWILVIAFLILLVTQYKEVKNLFVMLGKARWQWLVVAVLLDVCFYLSLALSYQSAFHAAEVETRVLDLIPVLLAALFVNVVTPAGGAAGIALIVDDTTRRGHPAARVTAGTILQLIADMAALTLILIGGVLYLIFTRQLETYVVVGAALLVLITCGMSGALMFGSWKPALFQRSLAWLQDLLNGLARRFKRPNFLAEDWSDKFASEFNDASAAMVRFPGRVLRTLLMMSIAHGVNITCLFVLFLAFYKPVPLGVLVVGYSVEFMFWVISIIPQGTGIVEGSLALVFASLGVPWTSALAVTLAFRGLAFWLPLGVGFLVLRRVKTFEGV